MSILDRLIKKVEAGNSQQSQAHPVLEVAQMHRRDIRDIMPIEEVVYPKPWTQKVFADEIEMMNRGHRYYAVAHIGRELVGYCGLLFADTDAHVTNIAVHPEWQQRGIATELMLELAWHARQRQYASLRCIARSNEDYVCDIRFGLPRYFGYPAVRRFLV